MNFVYAIIKTIVILYLFIFDSITFLFSNIFSRKKYLNSVLLLNTGGLGDQIIFLNSILQFKKDQKLSIVINKNFKSIDQNYIKANIRNCIDNDASVNKMIEGFKKCI